MYIVSRTKAQWHKDICTDPVIHGLVLNLYLNGEEYPHQSDDYFPIEHIDDMALADRMRSHLQDEDKHAALYRNAIRRMGQPVLTLPKSYIFNHVIRAHTPVSFRIEAHDSVDEKQLKIAHFFAHLHFLEKRVANSLRYHLDACGTANASYAEKIISRILEDEMNHETYTRQAVYDLLPRQKANEVLMIHQYAEKKADLDFSYHQVRDLLTQYGERFPRSRRWLYHLSSFVQEKVLAYV